MIPWSDQRTAPTFSPSTSSRRATLCLSSNGSSRSTGTHQPLSGTPSGHAVDLLLFQAPVSTTPGQSGGLGTLSPQVRALLNEAQSAYTQSQADLKAGNLGAYQNDINTLESNLQAVQALTGGPEASDHHDDHDSPEHRLLSAFWGAERGSAIGREAPAEHGPGGCYPQQFRRPAGGAVW